MRQGKAGVGRKWMNDNAMVAANSFYSAHKRTWWAGVISQPGSSIVIIISFGPTLTVPKWVSVSVERDRDQGGGGVRKRKETSPTDKYSGSKRSTQTRVLISVAYTRLY